MQSMLSKKIKFKYNPGKNDFENLHLFYNSSITIGSTVLLKPDRTCIDFKIFRVKDLVFKASAGHKQKVFNPSSPDQSIWCKTFKAFDRKMKNCQGSMG